MKSLLFILALFTYACGNGHISQPVPPTSSSDYIMATKAQIAPWILYSASGIVEKENNDYHDSLLWAGLLCLSGESSQCAAVSNSQGTDGRMWRAPELVDKKDVNSFSRDMLLGFLSYLVKTKDQAAAIKFNQYIESHGFLMCDDALDNRCIVTPNMFGLMRIVWNFIGLKPSSTMVASNVGDETSMFVSATTCQDYECHLIAVTGLIIKYCDKESVFVNKALKTLSAKELLNPLFQYLVNNFDLSLSLVKRFVPTSQPTKRFQWSFERPWAQYDANTSMVAEWLFLLNLLDNKK